MQRVFPLCWLVLLPVLGLSSCTTPSSSQEYAQYETAHSFSSGQRQDAGVSRTKFNLPSASLNTPLCGKLLHEQAQTGASIYGQSLMSGNSCVQNACFQPLTGTFVTADGSNSVCR